MSLFRIDLVLTASAATATAEQCDKGLLATLTAAAKRKTEDFKAQNNANTAWDFAKAKQRDN